MESGNMIFTPDYQLNKQVYVIVNTWAKEKHGLRFEKKIK